MAKVIMVQGTMSNAGKSVIVAGLCRIFKQDGYRVAPFKSQNMALNSFITKEGLEMGRAQVMQAEAAGIEPMVCMNPILLKPTNDVGSQVIVNGEVLGNMPAKEYFQYKKKLLPEIRKAFKKLEELADIIVIEGAGSPAEINLKENDIVNMGMAELVDAPVLLVGDIDRGGVFAQLLGTLQLLDAGERARVKGLIINKFRGDKSILDPGIVMLEERSGIPVQVVPYMDVKLEDEDSLTDKFEEQKVARIDLAVIRYPRISNFTDFDVFERMEQVSVRYVTSVRELGSPDMIFLPGSKNTIADLRWMRENGLEAAIKKRSVQTPVFGICGGYQMLGMEISDPDHVEDGTTIRGMELLKTSTILRADKVRRQTRQRLPELGAELLRGFSGQMVSGYEIHMGETVLTDRAEPAPAMVESGLVFGSYIHGFFDEGELALRLVQSLAERKGIRYTADAMTDYRDFKEQQYEILADTMRQYLDMEQIYGMLREAHDRELEETDCQAQSREMISVYEAIQIQKPDPSIYQQAKAHLDHLVKPLDALGSFENLLAQIASIRGTCAYSIQKKAIIMMCADNGIVAEGISQSGQEVTRTVTAAMGLHQSSVCRMAAVAGVDTIPVDIGVAADGEIPGVIAAKGRRGTRNFAVEPAMTETELHQAIQTGIGIVRDCAGKGYELIGTGEMGIGNTTTSTAVAAALLSLDVRLVTGRGAGLDAAGLERKRSVIRDAIRRYELQPLSGEKQENRRRAFRCLQCVGGLDLAGLAGVFIGGAICQIPIVVDGVISAVAALIAELLVPGCREYMIPSHRSRELTFVKVMEYLKLTPMIDAGMALGEGTGAVMLMGLLDQAKAVYDGGFSFDAAGMEGYVRFSDEIQEKG